MDNVDKDFAAKIKTVNVDRRKFLKYVAAVSSIAAIGPTLLAGCGTTAGPTAGTTVGTSGATGGAAGLVWKKGESIVNLFVTVSNDYYKFYGIGAEAAVKGLDMKYEYYLSEYDAAKQISQYETKASQGIKMFLISTPDASNVKAIADSAKQNQTYFTNTWNHPDWTSPIEMGEYYVTFFSPNSILAGYTMAKVLFDKMGGKGNFVHLTGWPGATPDWQRTMGVKRAMAEYPNIKMVATQPGKWNRIDARKAMEDILVSVKNIDGVFGQNDDVGIGGMNACEEHGLKVPVTGIDGNKETTDLVKAGRYYATMTSFPSYQAGFSAVQVFDAAHGWKPSVPERMLHTGCAVITQKNVDAYAAKFYSPTLPFDWQLMSRMIHPNDWDPQNEITPMDYEEFWSGMPKPAGYTLPAEIKAAKDAGEYQRITKLYADHYKKKIFEV